MVILNRRARQALSEAGGPGLVEMREGDDCFEQEWGTAAA